MFDLKTLNLVRERSIAQFNAIPSRCRLKGMTHDLDEDEKRVMAMYEAAVITAFQLRMEPPPPELFPRPCTASQEIVEGDSASYVADK